jgi:hypothetical protein
VDGAAHDEYKVAFLIELVNLAKDNPYPILIGGDFNLLRFSREKRKVDLTTLWLIYSIL